MRPHEVLPGLWLLPLRLSRSVVGHVCVYALSTPDGVVLVDTGWNDEDSATDLAKHLDTAYGAGLSDVVGVVVTHHHSDHCGLAGPLRRRYGAWIAMHPLEQEPLAARHLPPDEQDRRTGAWLYALGVPTEAAAEVLAVARELASLGEVVAPDHELADGLSVAVPGWDLVAEHMPGHTPGHVCLTSRSRSLVLAGDHLLPRMSASIMAVSLADRDPIGDYLTALDRVVREWPDLLVLPGHGAPYHDAPERAAGVAQRLTDRVEETAGLVAQGHRTVWEIAIRIGWAGGWASRTSRSKRAALGQTLALLRRLEHADRVRCVDDRPLIFTGVS